jgi:hypothetical protein
MMAGGGGAIFAETLASRTTEQKHISCWLFSYIFPASDDCSIDGFGDERSK